MTLADVRGATAPGHTTILVDAILFDLDNTLLDSGAVVERVWTEWAARHGIDVRDVLAVSPGRPGHEVMAELLPGRSAELNHADNAVMLAREERMLDGIEALPGALRLLRGLPAERWAIVTSCSRSLARARIAAAGLPEPEVLITADDVRAGKPDPECYRLGAEALGVDPQATVVVEDAPAGVAAGLALGATVLGVGPRCAEGAPPTLAVPDLGGVRVAETPAGWLSLSVPAVLR
ncbi:HAD-IA family hydrolase [Allonocardiopsis opalescens]|uniref:Sugar-phosphatase n=1 Tax=Allonocardiopsis opalescens TaxID=1144618 RepID=A0A2T0Q6U5_9ACTN|nr:HAD-IA family hydrolase [Allonocardiopsis opalescens]PRX99556.1 sugar-phosphatase [Allonocardiopsis opalescens]